MSVKGWLGFEEGGDDVVDLDEYLEGVGLHEGELLDEERFTYVKSLSASSPDALTDVERELKKGNIVLVDTENLAQSNRLTLKKLVEDLKALGQELDGDMGRVSETKILFVPSGFRILKRRLS